MSEIKIGALTISDIKGKIHKDENGKIVCCGRPMTIIGHMDGKDFYTFEYECECGNLINVTKKRSKEEMWW